MGREVIAGLVSKGHTVYYDNIEGWDVDIYDVPDVIEVPASDWPVDAPRLVIATPEFVLRHVGDNAPLYIYLAFEGDQISHAWVGLLDHTDKVIAISQFSADTIIRGGVDASKVLVAPCGVDSEFFSPLSNAEPHPFTFAAAMTPIHRKGPDALFRAYFRAFRRGEHNTRLIVKASPEHPSMEAQDFEGYLLDAAREEHAYSGAVESVTIIRDIMEKDAVRGFLGQCDCFVSLHRSEGFGLWIAQAMSMEKPVIATAYSGNMEFMDNINSFPVEPDGMEYIEHMPTVSCYTPQMMWATPNIDLAVKAMRYVVGTPGDAARKGRAARHTITTQFSWLNTVKILEDVMRDE